MHHFLGEEDIKWLAAFDRFDLDDNQKKTMIFLREALERIDAVARRSPFQIKYEDGLHPCGDWEKCATVLSRKDKQLELVKKW